MVESSLSQMTLWMQLGMKYIIEITLLYNYTIPITIPILECILSKNEMMKYKNSICYIFFKMKGQPFPYITTKEYNIILNVFNVVGSIYDRYKPKGGKSVLNYFLS